MDVVLVDLSLPICSLGATRRILAVAPSAHVMVLTRYDYDPSVAKVIAAELRQAGASALLPKNTSPTELVNAIHLVMVGDAVFPLQDKPDRTLVAAETNSAPAVLQPSLTLRQTQVLKLVAAGLANKEVADRLSISPKTVEKHRQSVKEKLRLNNAADLARRAVSLGLIQAT